MFGFTYNGKHSYNDFGIIIGKYNIPIVGELKEYRDTIPGLQGSIILQQPDYQDRTIELTECYIQYDPTSNLPVQSFLQQKMRSISAWLNPRNGPYFITFDNDNTVCYLGVVPEKVDTEIIGGITRKFTLKLHCDPFIYAVNAQTFKQLIYHGVFQVTNNGICELSPIITLTALSAGMDESVEVTGGFDPAATLSSTLTNPTITIGGKSISWTGTLNPGDSLVIDSSKFTVTKAGVNVFSGVSGDFPLLEPGNNNVSITDTTSTTGGLVQIQYQERWL